MAVVYNNPLKAARMQLVADIIGNKFPVPSSGTSTAGKIVIGAADTDGGTILTELAHLILTADVGSVSLVEPITLTIAGTPITAVGIGNGIANSARVEDSTGEIIISGLTVGTFGSNIVLTSTNITIGQQVQMTSGIITHG
jgi:hypothetical protein